MNVEDFIQFSKMFSANSICGTDTQYQLFTCLCEWDKYQQYPDIEIQLGNNVYVLPKEDYVQRVSQSILFIEYSSVRSVTSR